ncbi:MAG: nucleotidyltransferase family protein [Rhodobacteraceae bacterium]|nr:nucleotidyltransferase family protein [Paracoccaceae bacterium]
MVFAAGFGTRLGTLVADRPKPMIQVGGRLLIDHALDIVGGAGIHNPVVNLHYHAAKLAGYLQHRPGVQTVLERPQILDTGGGLSNAVNLLGRGPVFTLNSDTVWKGGNPLTKLTDDWKPEMMDALLLLVPACRAHGHSGAPDFALDPDGRIRRAGNSGLIYTGAQIIDTRILDGVEKKVFSLNEVWNGLIRCRRLYGIEYPGEIGDAGSPEGIEASEKLLRFGPG